MSVASDCEGTIQQRLFSTEYSARISTKKIEQRFSILVMPLGKQNKIGDLHGR